MRNTRKIFVALLVVMTLLVSMAVVASAAATTVDTTIYLTPNANWKVDNARFALYTWDGGDQWFDMTDTDGDGIYECIIPAGIENIIFCRMNPGTTVNNWNNKWNQTGDLKYDGTNNHYTVNEGQWDSGSNGTWSLLELGECIHTPTDEGTVVTAATCTVNGEVKHVCSKCTEEYTATILATGHSYAGAEAKCSGCDAQAMFTVAGDEAAMLGTEWDPSNTDNMLVYNAETGLWTISYTNSTDAEVWLDFKVCLDGGWNTAWGAYYAGQSDADNAYVGVPAGAVVTISFDYANQALAMTTHSHVWSDATCTEPQKCECGETQGEALGHTEEIDVAVAPTCTATGLTEGKHCSVCNEVLVAQTAVDALGHTEVEIPAEAPTCCVAGTTAGVYCSVCELVIIQPTEDPATGEHTYADGCTAEKPADPVVNDYLLNFSEWEAFAKETYADGDTVKYNDIFTFIYSKNSRVDSSSKTWDDFSGTQRFSFGGKTPTGSVPSKNALQITVDGAYTIKIWYVAGGDGRYFALMDSTGTVLSQTTAETVKNSQYYAELEISAAGVYYFGVPADNNYIFQIELVKNAEAPHEHVWSDATCSEPQKCECGETQGEALGHSYVDGACSACGAEDPDYVAPHVNALVVGDTNKIVISGETLNAYGYPIEWVYFTVEEKANYAFAGEGLTIAIFDLDGNCLCGYSGAADLDVGTYAICLGAFATGEYNAAVTKTAITETPEDPGEGGETPEEVDPIVNVSDLEVGTTTDAELIVGTGISASAGLTIDENNKSIDGFDFTKRLKLAGTMKVADGVVTDGIKIVTEGPSLIIVYAIAGNSSATDRFLQVATLADNLFTQVDITDTYVDGAGIAKYVFTVDEAGTYYLGSIKSGINLYYIAVEAHEHNYESVVTAPTCTEAGFTTYTCDCGNSYKADDVDALGHTNADAVEENKVDSTCSAAGSYDSVVYCSVCTAEISRTANTIDKKAHTEVIDAAVAATCTETGLTEGKHCSVCTEVTVAQETVDALGHKDENPKDFVCDVCDVKLCTNHVEEIISAVAATCTATGLTEGKKCSNCGEILEAQEEVDALGHTEVVDAAVAATCTETGLTEGKHCSVCTEVILAQETIDALGHTEEIVPGKAATCTEAGLTEGKKCSVCTEVILAQEEIAIADHSYNDGKCAGCGDENEDYNPLVMNFSNFVAYPKSTYTAGDNQVYNDYFTFIHNGDSRIDSSAKTFSDGFEATLRFNFGGTTAVGNVPSKSALKITTTGPMTLKLWWVSGGNDRLPVVLDANGAQILVAEASVKDSLYVTEFALSEAGTYYLGNVGGNNYWFKVELVPIDESHEHVWSDATCKELSKCSCGETQGELADHTPGDAATCTTAQVCTVCNEELVAALGHNYVDGVCDRDGCGAEEPADDEEGGEAAATKEVFKYDAAGEKIEKNTEIYSGTAFSVKLLGGSATPEAKDITAEDGTVFTAALVPGGSGRSYEITANKSGTITLYIAVTNGSFASKTADVTYGDNTLSITKGDSLVVYKLEMAVEAGVTYTVSSSTERLALFAVEFE